MLVECLRGFELLLKKFGPFPITSKQICLDSKGLLKVWINPDFSKNSVSTNEHSEYQMIQEIFDIFDMLIDEKGKSLNFNAYLFRMRQRHGCSVNFKNCLHFLVN